MTQAAANAAKHTNLSGSGVAPRRLLVIYNPKAGRQGRRCFDATMARISAAGCSVTVRETAKRHDAEGLARAAIAAETDVVVAAGGDGTVNEVLNGLYGSGLPLAVLPLGTVNLLGKELNLNPDPEIMAGVIREGPLRSVCLGRANGRLFAVVVGAGFDARVVAGVNRRLKRVLGRGAYVMEAVRQLLRPFPACYQVTVDGSVYRAAAVVIANGHYYAGRFVLAPQARLADPRLHVCLFEHPGRWNRTRYLLAMVTGRLQRAQGYRVLAGENITIEGPPGNPLQGDGDILTHLPASIEAVSDGIQLVRRP